MFFNTLAGKMLYILNNSIPKFEKKTALSKFDNAGLNRIESSLYNVISIVKSLSLK
jgi:hypothetical protein